MDSPRQFLTFNSSPTSATMSYSDDTSPAPCKWVDFLRDIPLLECPTSVKAGTILATHRGHTTRFYAVSTVYQACDLVEDEFISASHAAFSRSQTDPIIPAAHYSDLLENETAAAELYSTMVLRPCVLAINALVIERLKTVASKAANDSAARRLARLLLRAKYKINRRYEETLENDECRIDMMTTLEPFFQDDTNGTAPKAPVRWLSPEEFGQSIAQLANEVHGNGAFDEDIFQGLDRSRFPRMVLTVVEVKKPGTFNHAAWDEASRRSGTQVKRKENALRNVRIIDGQLAAYSVGTCCKYCILTEYNENILLKIEAPALDLKKAKGKIARTSPKRQVLYQRNSAELNPRYLMFLAMCKSFSDINGVLWEAILAEDNAN
ncbi:hypothetical protein BDZ89DRAFT_1087500 [Hymenopellis radicata]|nr:hypothetical protein BDZ89DRAFT_1087500 [Hymenopellis radicata]